TLEIDLQRAIEGELKGPIFCLTHRHSTSAPPLIASKPTSVNDSARSYHTSSTPGKWKSGPTGQIRAATYPTGIRPPPLRADPETGTRAPSPPRCLESAVVAGDRRTPRVQLTPETDRRSPARPIRIRGSCSSAPAPSVASEPACGPAPSATIPRCRFAGA